VRSPGGGEITLKDADGLKVYGVSYSRRAGSPSRPRRLVRAVL